MTNSTDDNGDTTSIPPPGQAYLRQKPYPMPAQRVVLVTGANRNIGFAILQALALRSPSDQYLLGCRNLSNYGAAMQELRKRNIKSPINLIQIDLTSDQSLRAAGRTMELNFSNLDVLINNASSAVAPDVSDYRSAFSAVYDIHVAFVAVTAQLFLPLLRESPSGIVINVSLGRALFGISSSGKMPPTVSIP